MKLLEVENTIFDKHIVNNIHYLDGGIHLWAVK